MEDGYSIFKQHYIEILTFVKQNQPCKKNDIYEILDGSRTTRIKHVNDLILSGLLIETKMGQYNKKVIEISEKGLEILKSMQYINAIMNDEVLPDERNHGTPSASDAKAEGE